MVGIGSFDIRRYIVNEDQSEKDDIFGVYEIANKYDEWRNIDKDLLAVAYTNGKVNIYDIEQ